MTTQKSISDYFKRSSSSSAGGKSGGGSKKRRIEESPEKENSSSGSSGSKDVVVDTKIAKNTETTAKTIANTNMTSNTNTNTNTITNTTTSLPLGSSSSFSTLSTLLSQIESTSKRTDIIELTTSYLTSIFHSPTLLSHSIHLLNCTLSNPWDSVELGVGESMLIKALSLSTSYSTKQIKSLLAEKGDLGTVAAYCKSRQKQVFKTTSRLSSNLSISDVYNSLLDIAKNSNNNNIKINKINKLLVKAVNNNDIKYITRILECKLRIGLAEQSILTALGEASNRYHSQCSSVDEVRDKYNEVPCYDEIIKRLVEGGIEALKTLELTPFIPLKPMLAHPTKSLGEIFERFGGGESGQGGGDIPFTCEYKYDGERAQIHYVSGVGVRIFSRSQEDMTDKYPDVVEIIKAATAAIERDATAAIERDATAIERKRDSSSSAEIETTTDIDDTTTPNTNNNTATPNTNNSTATTTTTTPTSLPLGSSNSSSSGFILDCEIVAIDSDTKDILPFQVLSTRKRKDVKVDDIKVKIRIYAFDCLYINGRSLLRDSLRGRREEMRKILTIAQNNDIQLASSMDSTDLNDIQLFLQQSITDHCEGLMVKTLDCTYEPSKRSRNWLKVKKDYLDETAGDSLDLVVIGGYLGKGKRRGVYGGYLLASVGDDGGYEAICKIGTGFSDEDLREQYSRLQVISTKPSYYHSNIQADVWFEASEVWEVRAADLSMSPVYSAGSGYSDDGRGVSLRFPRYLRRRDDKRVEDATSSEQVYEMYKSQ